MSPSSLLMAGKQKNGAVKPWRWVLGNSEIQILLYMSSPKNVLAVFKDVTMTYYHLFNTIREMEKKQLLSTEKIGRERIVTMTKKGIAIQLLLDRIDEEMRK